MYKEVYLRAYQEEVKAVEHGVENLCLVGSLSSYDKGLMGQLFLKVPSFKKPIKTPRVEEIVETVHPDQFGRNTLYCKFSRREAELPLQSALGQRLWKMKSLMLYQKHLPLKQTPRSQNFVELPFR